MDVLAVDKWLNQSTDPYMHTATEMNVGITKFLKMLRFAVHLRRAEKVKE